MLAAWALTFLALIGIGAGVFLGQSRLLSSHLAAAGGGLLFGISLFWLIPEIAEMIGWGIAIGVALSSSIVLAIFDRMLMHTGHSPRSGVIGPLLAATAVHSLLDGWSVRVVANQPLAAFAAPLGLALHKIPEGLALGWVTRKSLFSASKALLLGCAVEAMTLVGAYLEPHIDRSAAAAFGPWWTVAILAIITGGFLFLGFHAVSPSRREKGVVPVFIATFLAVGGAAFIRLRIGHV